MYPCHKCHNLAQDHAAQWSDNMVCGYCSHPQNCDRDMQGDVETWCGACKQRLAVRQASRVHQQPKRRPLAQIELCNDKAQKPRESGKRGKTSLLQMGLSDIAPDSLPLWFLENCILTAEELQTHPPSLILRKDCADTEGSSLANDEIADMENLTFEVDPLVYEAMHSVLARNQGGTYKEPSRIFGQRGVYLRFPMESDGTPIGELHGSVSFMSSLVERFAADIGADLVTLGLQDILDLGHHFDVEDRYAGNFWERDERANDRRLLPLHANPFHRILFGPRLKISHEAHLQRSKITPLIIHIPELWQYHCIEASPITETSSESGSSSCSESLYMSEYRHASMCLQYLDTQTKRSHGNMLLLFSNQKNTPWCGDIRTVLIRFGMPSPIKDMYIFPILSDKAKSFFKDADQNAQYFVRGNIRRIQRKLRDSPGKGSLSTLQPYSLQEFSPPEDSSLRKGELDDMEIEKLRIVVGWYLNDGRASVQDSLMKALCHQTLKLRWTENTRALGEWDRHPPHIRSLIRGIIEGGHSERNDWLKRALECLVQPSEWYIIMFRLVVHRRNTNAYFQILSRTDWRKSPWTPTPNNL